MYILLSVVDTALDGDKTHDLYRSWPVSSGETVFSTYRSLCCQIDHNNGEQCVVTVQQTYQ